MSSLIVLLLLIPGGRQIRAQKSVPDRIYALPSRLAEQKTSILSADALIKMEGTGRSGPAGKSNLLQISAQVLIKNFLETNKSWFGLTNVQDELKLTRIRRSPGGEHFTYDAYLQNIPVFHSQIVVSTNNRNEICFIMSNYRSTLQLTRTVPDLTAAQALKIAREYLDVRGFMHSEPELKLMVFETTASGARLAYRIRLGISDPLGDWQLFVDAASGEILEIRNALRYQSGSEGSGAVWIPDPLTMAEKYYGSDGYSDNNDQNSQVLNDRRLIVPLHDLHTDNTGNYILEGPYIKLSDKYDPPDVFPSRADPDSFIFTRDQQEFEDVMVYYHADQSYRRLMSLGFSSEALAALQADPHGHYSGVYEDNSFYSPLGNFCVFGEVGVDDAEDATVIWHEYTHAIQRNISNVQFSAAGETFSLLEGAADYWAASYKRRLSEFEWPQLFLWDAGIRSAAGDATFWSGRRCDKDWHYPEDYSLYDGTHEGGQIWSSALMRIWADLGADVTDALFLLSHYYWSETPGFPEAAESIIQADRDLFESSHLAVLTTWFDHFGFIDRTDYLPRIIHSKHSDTEDLTGPYPITCRILAGEAALDPQGLWLFWQTDSLQADSARLIPAAGDEFSAEIPGTGNPAMFSYFLKAVDLGKQIVFYPSAAPAGRCIFYTGPDTLLPLIEHQRLEDQLLLNWPPEISAAVIDNLGIDSVWVEYYVQKADSLKSFYLQAQDSNLYAGRFLPESGGMKDGDTIHYRIIARDLSSLKNQRRLPAEGFYHFVIYQTPLPPQNLQVLDRDDKVILGWEENQQKVPVYYNVYRTDNGLNFTLLDSTRRSPFIDTTAYLGGTYHYYLTTVFEGWESPPSDTIKVIVEAVVAVENDLRKPRAFRLAQNYPNPFNPKTIINYELPMSNYVNLSIYNLLGQKVATLVDKKQAAGRYQVLWDASGVASGVYLYRLNAGDFIETKKLILLR